MSDNDLHPLIDPSPLTPEETDGLLRAIWQDGTDEDREAMRRAGFDFGEEAACDNHTCGEQCNV